MFLYNSKQSQHLWTFLAFYIFPKMNIKNITMSKGTPLIPSGANSSILLKINVAALEQSKAI